MRSLSPSNYRHTQADLPRGSRTPRGAPLIADCWRIGNSAVAQASNFYMRLRPHLVLLLIIATACHSSQNCTLVGCGSGVSVQVQGYVAAHPTLTRLTLCADS